MSNYSAEFNNYAERFKALGNSHRLAIFHRLTTCCAPGTRCSAEEAVHYNVGQLGEGLDIAPSTLSHHLRELKRAGLIEIQRHGKYVECWVEPALLQAMASLFNSADINTTQERDHE